MTLLLLEGMAPKHPTISQKKSHNGSAKMDGRSICSGGAGCSSNTAPPPKAIGMHSQSPRRKRQLPTESCRSSLRDNDSRPQQKSECRRGRGPRTMLPNASLRGSKRAPLQVSQGGPRRNPRILPERAVVKSHDQTASE